MSLFVVVMVVIVGVMVVVDGSVVGGLVEQALDQSVHAVEGGVGCPGVGLGCVEKDVGAGFEQER